MVNNNLDKIKKELQKTKEDLNDIASYLDDFLTFLPIPVCDLSPNGMIVHINKSFEDVSGFGVLEIVGEHFTDIFLEKSKINKILNLVRKKGILKNQEITLITKNKKKIIVNAFFSARKDKEGNLTGYFLGMIDITSLKEFQYEMETKVKERTKELKERLDELEKFHKLTVGRELKMVVLKEEIQKLTEELEKSKGRQ